MTRHETYGELRRAPFWTVQSVFDPGGGGAEFAYTIGLHERGLPELHLWARPTLGEDPGHDWMFSVRDRTIVLNELAAKLVVGRLAVGSEVTETFDSGLATVHFRVDPPGDREELQAFGIADGADVLPVRWSLHRLPEGEPMPLAETSRARIASEIRLLLWGQRDREKRPPRGWEVPQLNPLNPLDPKDEPDFGVEQAFGPLTPLVTARATQLWQANDRALERALELSSVVEHADSLSHRTSLAIAAARPVGRRKALERLHHEVHELVWWLTERPAAQRRWRSVVESVVPPDGRRSLRERKQIERRCAGLLHDLVLGCLAVDAVADVAERSLLIAGRGPWVRIFDESVEPDWWADDSTQDAVRRLLLPLDADGLLEVGRRHQAIRFGPLDQAEQYDELVTRLIGWSMVGPAACAWELTLGDLPGWDPFIDWEAYDGCGYPESAMMPRVPSLEDWATCLTSALTHRDRLSEEDVAVFVAPFADLLPGLEGLLVTWGREEPGAS